MRVCSIVGMLSCFILLSCHFRDDRVMVVNKDGRELLFAVSLLNPKEREDILSPFRPIKPGEMRTIPLLRNLNYEFIDVDSVSILQITRELEMSVLIEQNNYYEYEQILKDKSFNYVNISTKEIIERDKYLVIYTPKSFRKVE